MIKTTLISITIIWVLITTGVTVNSFMNVYRAFNYKGMQTEAKVGLKCLIKSKEAKKLPLEKWISPLQLQKYSKDIPCINKPHRYSFFHTQAKGQDFFFAKASLQSSLLIDVWAVSKSKEIIQCADWSSSLYNRGSHFFQPFHEICKMLDLSIGIKALK